MAVHVYIVHSIVLGGITYSSIIVSRQLGTLVLICYVYIAVACTM